MIFKKPLYQIPVPSTEFGGDAYLHGDSIRYEYYRDGILYRSGIRFQRVPATRTRAERCCKLWHSEDAYDTLVEVEGSQWLDEIRADTAERWRNEWETHHYMIYLDSAGCFEFIAASWEVLPEEQGSWAKTQAT
jgi:hypothetical protein